HDQATDGDVARLDVEPGTVFRRGGVREVELDLEHGVVALGQYVGAGPGLRVAVDEDSIGNRWEVRAGRDGGDARHRIIAAAPVGSGGDVEVGLVNVHVASTGITPL